MIFLAKHYSTALVAIAVLMAAGQQALANSADTAGIVITIGAMAPGDGDLASSSSPRVRIGKALDIEGRPVTSLQPAGHQPPAGPAIAPLSHGRLSSLFGMRMHPVTGQARRHAGIDIAAPAGTPVLATSAGRVNKASWQGAYGLLVSLDHPGGLQTRYAHLSRVLVAPGQYVRKGDVIGLVGSTGRSTGSHLHYETRANGMAKDPLALHAAARRNKQADKVTERRQNR